MSSVLRHGKKVCWRIGERGVAEISWRGLGSGEMNDGRNVNEMGMELQ